jgi:hypothetical protein
MEDYKLKDLRASHTLWLEQPSSLFFFLFPPPANFATVVARSLRSCRGNVVHKGHEDHKHWAFAGIIFFFVFF